MFETMLGDLRAAISPVVLAEVAAALYGVAASEVKVDALVIPSKDQPLRFLFAAMQQLVAEDAAVLTRQCLSRAIAARLLRAQPAMAGAPKPVSARSFSAKTTLSPQQMDKVQKHIAANLVHGVGMKEMAAHIGMNAAKFTFRLKATTGTTLHQLVIAARVEKARALLSDKTLNIDVIATACGFTHASHFSEVFRKYFTMSPATYRARVATIGVPAAALGSTWLQPAVDSQELARAMAEFSLQQTTLRIDDKVRLVASSQGLGWNDMFVAITDELPHDTLHRVLSDTWLTLALTPVDMQRSGADFEYKQFLPEGSINITGSGEAVYDNMPTAQQVAYVYLRREVLEQTADELLVGGSERSNERRTIGSRFCVNDAVLQPLLMAISLIVQEPRGSHPIKGDYLAQTLAARLLERHSVLEPARALLREPVFSTQEIGLLVDYINEHLASSLSIVTLAGLVGLGRTQFIGRFKATAGVTPHQFIIARRICKAKALLSSKTVEHKAIAAHCGFASHTHFITGFKKAVGVTPWEYCRRNA